MMMRAGVIGVGDMGSGLAKNLIAAGHPTAGYDLLDHRMQGLEALGGTLAESAAEVAAQSDAVFIMVMQGAEARDVIFGENGLLGHLAPGSTIILTATIKPSEARAIGEDLAGSGIDMIDSPVSGGFPGAQNGTLTLMSAGSDEAMHRCEPVMQAVSANIHRVGTVPGEGQTVKACLQSLIGSIFAGTYEAAALAARAGVSGEVLRDVFSTSSAGCGIVNGSLDNIIDRQFEGTGSHIRTMHKDLTISLDLGQTLEVPLHTAATAMQLFHAGKTRYPDGDNQAVARVLEEMVGAELHR